MIETTAQHQSKATVARLFHLPSRTQAAAYLGVARALWVFENCLQWVLDGAFSVDRSRNRRDHGPESLATLRKPALNTVNHARRDISVRRKRKRSGGAGEFARSMLGQIQ
jgi:predicted transposase YbfD/YdcC